MGDGNSKLTSTNQIRGHAWHSEPILGLGVYLSGSPWRLGPAWAVLAGALASQAPIWAGGHLLRLGGSLLLADAVWGVLWRRTDPRQEVLPKRQRGPVLPYFAAHSPLMQAQSGLRYEVTEGGETGWQGTVVGLGLAAVLGILLGTPAIVLTLLAILASVGIRLMVRRGKKPAFMMALLSMGLPWALGAALGWAGDAQPSVGFSGACLMLGAAFTCLTWSVHRFEGDDCGDLVGQIWLGQIIILATLIAIREPLGLAIAGGLLVVPCLWISRRPHSGQEVVETLRNSDLWWLASMLTAALAVRF